MAGRRIVVEFLGKDTSLGKTADQSDSKVSKLGSKFREFGAKAGPALAGGILVAGAAMVKFGNQASDLAETQSKINQIFGSQGARNLNNFADSAAKTMGQSKQMALDAAATFGMFGKAAGQSGTDLVNFSTRMSVLASDMASFNNTSPEQAIEAIGAALRGESEPIRAYGVMLNDAALKAEALSMGLLKPVKDSSKIASANAALLNAQQKYNEAVKEHGKNSLEAVTAQAHLGAAQSSLKKATDGTIGPLTQQQKILASQSLIIKQTKDQQGDFARTSSGLANKQRILKAEFENLTTQLGQKALPIMLKVTDWALKAINWMEKHQTLIKGIATVVVPLIAGLYALAKAQAVINLVMTANPIGIVIVAIAALAAGLVYAYKHSETFRKIVDQAFHDIAAAAKWMWNDVLKPTFRFLINGFLSIVGAIISGAAKAFGWVPGLGGKLKKAAANFEQFKTDVNNQLNGIKPAKIKVDDKQAREQVNEFRKFFKAQMGLVKKNANIHVTTSGGIGGILGDPSKRAMGGPVWAGQPYIVGERRPELFVPSQNGRIIPNVPASGQGFMGTVAVDLRLDGKTIQTVLLKLKRDKGGTALGLA